MTEPARKNVGAAPIANRKYSEILMWGEPRGQNRARSGPYQVKRNSFQSESKLSENGSITNAVIAQHRVKWIWTPEMEDQLVDLKQQQTL